MLECRSKKEFNAWKVKIIASASRGNIRMESGPCFRLEILKYIPECAKSKYVSKTEFGMSTLWESVLDTPAS